MVHEFSFNHGAVLALVAKGDTIYAGCQDGYVKVLDLETKTLVRTIIVQEGIDILALSRLGSDLYTCSANGWIKVAFFFFRVTIKLIKPSEMVFFLRLQSFLESP